MVSEGAEQQRVQLFRNFWKPGLHVMNAFGWCMHTQRPEYDFRCLPFDVCQNAFCQGFSVNQNWSFLLGWLASMLSGCPSLYLPMPALQVHAAGPDFLWVLWIWTQVFVLAQVFSANQAISEGHKESRLMCILVQRGKISLIFFLPSCTHVCVRCACVCMWKLEDSLG